jgi:Protein of unknown function (DUF3769)
MALSSRLSWLVRSSMGLRTEPKKGEANTSPFLFRREIDSMKMNLGIAQQLIQGVKFVGF